MAPHHLRAAYNALLDAVGAKRREKARLEQLRADLIEQCAQERRARPVPPAAAVEPPRAIALVKASRVTSGQQVVISGYRWIVRQILDGGLMVCDSLDARCPPRFRQGTTLSAVGGYVLVS